MNQKKAKEIRSIVGLQDDPVARRNYRGIKKEYISLSDSDKKRYLDNLRKLFDN